MNDETTNKSAGFLRFVKKHRVLLIVLAVLIAVMIPLIITCPGETALKDAVPQEFTQLEAKKESDTFNTIGIMSAYKAQKQISAAQAEQVLILGIAGQAVNAEGNVFTTFFVNFVAWLPSLLDGAWITIALTISSVAAGVLLSVFIALGKMSKIVPISMFCRAYVFFFRGTPLLMQLYFLWFGLPLLFPALTISDRFLAAFIAFSLNSAAYCAENIRAAIESIDKGQFEAAKALGLSYGQTMRKIIIPQTYRRLIPPIANEFIMVLKDASLTSIIALQDLSKITNSILTSSGEVSVYIVSMVIYLIITAVFSKVFGVLEKKFSVYD
ncbi:MAG: amino acid ABC transporter permease [Oscillospiraceae bacterium]